MEKLTCRPTGVELWRDSNDCQPSDTRQMNETTFHTRSEARDRAFKTGDGSSVSNDSSLRSLVDTSLQGIIVHRDWQILFANPAAAQTLGYASVTELVSVGNVLNLFPKSEHGRLAAYRDARLQGERVPDRYQARLLHKGGTPIWAEVLASVLDWEGGPAIQAAFVDISESVRAQQLLKESEERLRSFMDNTPALMTLKSLDNRYLLVNRAFENFVRPSGNPPIGSTPSQLMTREHARMVAEHDRMVLNTYDTVTLTRDLVHLDGTRYCRRVTKFPVFDAAERLIGIGSCSVDISDWKQTEETLHARDSLIEAISENLPGALFRRVLRADGRLEFSFISDSLHRLLGIDRESVINDAQVLVQAFHPEDRVRWMAALKESAATLKQVNVDLRVGGPRGDTRWLRSLARPQKLDDGTIVWDGLALDVTDEKNAAEALRESEERFRNLVEGSLQGIGIVNTDFEPLFVNNAYAAMFGYWNIEDMQRLDSHLELFPVEDRDRLMSYGDARLRGETVPMSYELDGIRKDGSVVHMVSTLRLIAWKGQPAFQITATDISERKRTEARLHDYQLQLRRLASEISLAEEKERRRIASELHDSTIQSLALAKIKLGEIDKGNSEENKIPALDDVRELLEQSIHAARSLIFELSPPVLYELGLGAAAEWLGEQFQTRYGIDCNVEADQIDALLDVEIEVVLFQVLRELLINVVKHANATCVEIRIRCRDNRMTLEISDDGDGFDATNVVTSSGRGGFGLFNIRERLQLLGAAFEIDSGPGTRVIVTAPLATGSDEKQS